MKAVNKPRKLAKRRYCPVGKNYLGMQEPDMEVSLHCEDCRVVYTWFPGVSKPTSMLDRNIPKICTCAACNARRGDTE